MFIGVIMKCPDCHKGTDDGFICLRMKFDLSLWFVFNGSSNVYPPSIIWKDKESGKEKKLKDNVRKPVSIKGTKCKSCNQIITNYAGVEVPDIIICKSCGVELETGKLYTFQKLHNSYVYWKPERKNEEQEIKLPDKPTKEAYNCPGCNLLIF